MDTKILRQKILDLAIQGKLVPQDPDDEPASVLLERIRAEKQQMVKDGKLKAKYIKNDTIIFKDEDNLHYEKFQDGTVKCIEDEIPFEISEGWEWCRLGTILDTLTGSTPSTKDASLYGNDYPFYKPADLENGYFVYDSINHVSEKGYLSGRILPPKSVLVTCIGTIGKTGLIRKTGICNQQINAIIASRHILSEYIFFFFSSGFGQKQIITNASATTLPILNKRKFDHLLFALPPIKEQKKIVNKTEKILEYIDSIDSEKKEIDILTKCFKSKILDLAIRGKLVPQDPNDEPASVLLERIRIEKEELIKQGKIKRNKKKSIIFKGDDNSYYEKINGEVCCIDEEIPFKIPDTWEWIRLENCCRKEIRRGKSPKYAEQSKTLVFAQKCNTKYNGIDIRLAQFLDENTLRKYPMDEYMKDGDIVINSTGTGTLGRVGFYQMSDNCENFDVVPDSHVTVVRASNNLNFFYLYAFMKANQIELEKKGEGSTNQKELKPATLKEMLIPIPPAIEQKRISATIMKIFSIITDIEKNLS